MLALEVTDSGDSFIEGTVDAGDGGMLVTSVPYDMGWTLKVDGQEQEIQELLLHLPIHQIHFSLQILM